MTLALSALALAALPTVFQADAATSPTDVTRAAAPSNALRAQILRAELSGPAPVQVSIQETVGSDVTAEIRGDAFTFSIDLQRDVRVSESLRRTVLDRHSEGLARDWALLTTPQTFMGRVRGAPNTLVSAVVRGEEISALLHDLTTGRSVSLTSERDPASLSSYRLTSVGSPGAAPCGCPILPQDARHSSLAGSQARSTGLVPRGFPVQLDTHPETVAAWGNDAAALLDHIEEVTHHTSVLYEFQLGVSVTIVDVCIRDGSCSSSYVYPSIAAYPNWQEPAHDVKDAWDLPANEPHVYAHLFLPGDLDGKAGAASGWHCSLSSVGPGGWSNLDPNDSLGRHVQIMAHEIGHTYSINHTNGAEGSSGLMKSSSTGFLFSDFDRDIARQHLTNFDCLSAGDPEPPAPTLTSITPAISELFDPLPYYTITGTDLDEVFEIQFGGVYLDLLDFEPVSPSEIRVDLAPFSLGVGTHDLTLRGRGGESSGSVEVTEVSTPVHEVLMPIFGFGAPELRSWGPSNGTLAHVYSFGSDTAPLGAWDLLSPRMRVSNVVLALNGNGFGWEPWNYDPTLSGTTVWSQAIAFGTSGALAGTSNIVETLLP